MSGLSACASRIAARGMVAAARSAWAQTDGSPGVRDARANSVCAAGPSVPSGARLFPDRLPRQTTASILSAKERSSSLSASAKAGLPIAWTPGKGHSATFTAPARRL